MSAATFHFPQYKLGKLLRRPGGKSVRQALEDAGVGLTGLREECLAHLEAKLVEIDTLWAAAEASENVSDLGDLYGVLNNLIGVAGAAGLADFDRVAYSLCDILEHITSTGRFQAAAVAVHVRALHLLRQPAMAADPNASAHILGGLTKVRALTLGEIADEA